MPSLAAKWSNANSSYEETRGRMFKKWTYSKTSMLHQAIIANYDYTDAVIAGTQPSHDVQGCLLKPGSSVNRNRTAVSLHIGKGTLLKHGSRKSGFGKVLKTLEALQLFGEAAKAPLRVITIPLAQESWT